MAELVAVFAPGSEARPINIAQSADERVAVLAANFSVLVTVAIVESWLFQARMDAPQPNPNIPHCPSCGKPMLARTVPGSGSSPELRSFECRVCGIVITAENTRPF